MSNRDPFSPIELKTKDKKTKLLETFMTNMRVIELTNADNISEVVTFPIIRECQELSDEICKEILEDFDHHNPTALFFSILSELRKIRATVQKKVAFNKKFGILYKITDSYTIYVLKVWMIIFCFVLNYTVLQFGQEGDNKNSFASNPQLFIDITSWVILVISCVIVVLVTCLKLPIIWVKSRDKDNRLEKMEVLYDYMKASVNFWGHIICVFLTWNYSPLFYTLHLLLSVTLFESTMFIVK